MVHHRRVFLLFPVVMAAILGSFLVAGPAQAATTFRNIVNFGSEKCVDVRTQNGFTVQLYSCNGNDNKVFNFDAREFDVNGNTLYLIHPKSNTNHCLAPANNVSNIGREIHSTGCDTRTNVNQEWRLLTHVINNRTWHEIQHVPSGLCMTVRGGAGANGTIIEQNICNASPADLWRI